MKELLEHLIAGGQIINEKGDTLKSRGSGYEFTGSKEKAPDIVTHPSAIIGLLAKEDWKIVPEYSDGIYTAKCFKFDSEVTLIKQGNEWGETDIAGYSKSCIKDYIDVTYIGPLPSKEPTIANKIAAVPNDFVPDWGDHHQEKWTIMWYEYNSEYEARLYYAYRIPGVTYFRTKEEAQRVIDEVLS